MAYCAWPICGKDKIVSARVTHAVSDECLAMLRLAHIVGSVSASEMIDVR